MSFVFVPSAPSDRAQHLARRVTATIEAFQRENPTTTGMDIQQALQLARQSKAAPARITTIVGVILAVILGLGMLFLMENR